MSTPGEDSRVVDFHTMWIIPEWVRQHCVIPDGHQAGDPYIPTEWQDWFYLNYYRVKPDAPLPTEESPGIGAPAFHYRRAQIVTPQKALAVDTAVLTTRGWSTMGDLAVGDFVYDADHAPTEVVGKSKVFFDPCYAVEFDGGAVLVAGSDHRWLVTTDAVKNRMFLDTLTVAAVLKVGRVFVPGSREVLSVRRVPTVPTQCITVASPTRAFLAGPECIVTGNSGKGPLTATQLAVEGVGPAMFAGWAMEGDYYACSENGCPCGWVYDYDPGEAMGTPWPTPLIQVTAFSVEQAANVYDAFKEMVKLGPLGDIIDKPAEDFARLPGGGRIDRVTSSQQSRLGQRVTFVAQDEALALNTPIPTPMGWSTMGELRVGAEVIGSDGRPTTVTKATDVQWGRDCYRVTFPDGTSVTASDGHLWATIDDLGVRGVRTTGGMFASGRFFRVPIVHTKRGNSAFWAQIRIERADSVPVRCIGVAAPDRLFVVGESAKYLTHNTGIWLVQNKMDKVATTQRRGASGMKGRTCETTNAWDPSENSVAQKTYEASLRVDDIFRIHPQAPPHLSFRNKAERLKILKHVYTGSPWIDIPTINAEAEEIMLTDPAQAERFYGNRIVAGLGQWMSEEIYDKSQADIVVPFGATIALGFDGSDSDDWTALRAVTIDGHHFTPRYGPNLLPTYWNPAEWNGSIPRAEVSAAIDWMFEHYNVRRLYADPRDWQTEIGDWAVRHGDERVLEWATYRTIPMHAALVQSLSDYKNGLSTHDDCAITKEHMKNARKAATQADRYILAKPNQHRKIDLAMADTLAHVAAFDLKVSGKWEEKKRGLTRVKGRTHSS